VGVVDEIHLSYSERYIAHDIPPPGGVQVVGGKLRITTFGAEDVRVLSLLLSTILLFTVDGHHISCMLLYYVDSFI
jgi:hypothetical protein